MARPLRIQYAGAVYHVMNRGSARRKIFLDELDYQNFLQCIQEASERWKFQIYAYCLMGNHYHLCIKTREANLSRIMRHINGVYTQRFNQKEARDGALFRGRYKAILIEEDEYLASVVRYIHLNPVKAGLVDRPERYPWSSHKVYKGKKKPKWLHTNKMIQCFGSASAFYKFVLEGNEKSLLKLYAGSRLPSILGGEDFITQVRGKTLSLNHEHVRGERQFVRPSMQDIFEIVAKEMNVPISKILDGKRGELNLARKITLWSLRQFGDYTYEQIATATGLNNARSVSGLCKKLQMESLSNAPLKKKIMMISEKCQDET